MNNEIKRKITSLTLMTIMLAGGMIAAAPSMVPAAHAANANLFVSAENSQFNNYMSGPQVIEVVIIDSDINDTDEAKGEPDVTVNGKILRMVQAVDGNWYGYFADREMASKADSTAVINSGFADQGLDFGTFCATGAATNTAVGVNVDDTVGIAIPSTPIGGANGTSAGSAFTVTCSTPSTGDTNATTNVVRESKTPNTTLTGDQIGQIGLASVDVWPFVQLYSLNPTGNVVIQYNKGGGAQTTTLTFDTVEGFANSSLDRTIYPQSAQVHLTVTDLWLNIDPTDEDSWTFGSQSSNSTSFGAYYQVFNENGGSAGDTVADGAIQLTQATLQTMMIETNGLLRVNANTQSATNPVLTLQDNSDSILTCDTANTATTCLTTGAETTVGNELDRGSVPITITEQGPNSGIFGSYDESDTSALKITTNAARGTSATVDYNETPVTILVGNSFATIDIAPTDDEWNSGEEIPLTLVDGDANKNSRADEDLDLINPDVALIPSLKTGDPFTLGDGGTDTNAMFANTTAFVENGVGTAPAVFTMSANRTATDWSVQSFSQRAIFTNETSAGSAYSNALLIQNVTTIDELRESIGNTNSNAETRLLGFNFLNLDVSNFGNSTVDVYLLNGTATRLSTQTVTASTVLQLAQDVNARSLTSLNNTALNNNLFQGQTTGTLISFLIVTNSTFTDDTANDPIVLDFFSFGFYDDGLQASERVANQIVRLELEETGDNTSTFAGSLEYTMINQLNILNADTYSGLSPIDDEATFIVIEDLTDEDAPRVNYLDLGSDGVSTQIADQEEAPSHSGVVSFNSAAYKTADTVIITLEDLDLNVDSDLIEIYTTVTGTSDPAYDSIGRALLPTLSWGNLGQLLDVTFDDQRWMTPASGAECLTDLGTAGVADTGLGDTGFTLVETGSETGIFVGDFQIPAQWCRTTSGTLATDPETTTGLDIEVNYEDFRDASGEIVEVGDGAGVRANTGSVSLDRTVYPVPFGVEGDFADQATKTTPTGRALFPIHQTGMDTASTSRSGGGLQAGEFLANGDLTIHVRVNDPDFNISAAGEDSINANSTAGVGPVKISVIRGSSEVILGYAGGPAALAGIIDTNNSVLTAVRQFGPMVEIAGDAGIFESDIVVRYTDGPASTDCSSVTDTWTNLDGAGTAETDRFDTAATTGDYCILQGDIIQVEYTDPADASGDVNTVTDSATFDLRNGVLQSDKSVYIIGSDMILTLIEPDFDLDNDQAETYDLDLIEWDSDAATVTMGDADGAAAAFDPEPTTFRETGDSTGIFQIVIEIPEVIEGTERLERGEEIVLEYTDWGPSGSDFVGDEDEDVNLTIFTSNFGATVELDQKVYTWTDKVYITIVAPDHNFDSNLVDEIGDTDLDPIKVSTRSSSLDNYKLVETGTDTGIFTGEVILIGFTHDADGDTTTGNSDGNDVVSASASGSGPTSGLLPADDDDGLTVSFEFSEDETIVGSALIRWNIGEVQWLEASYPASGTGVVRVIDPDMNLNPEAVDNFNADVWSDSDAGGIDLTVTETNEATGIFEGTVFFTTTDESSGHRLRVAEGDTVTAEYEDNTLPNPYTTADELDISATSLIGTVVPPLERAPAANLRTVDAFGNSLSTVSVDQQVQITADLANGQDREQAFAYLVQIQDGNGVTVSLAWITGSLSAGQSFSPALSWIPTDAGEYTATAFVWESVDNPTALSPPVSTTITVQ
ncbi:MAG: hypothetical protein K8Q88_07260 [Nitrosarchaeum sp.]|nr:hypothetical protein [Nitrosarchaeum sp.]